MDAQVHTVVVLVIDKLECGLMTILKEKDLSTNQ
jgi:hypothetical protein